MAGVVKQATNITGLAVNHNPQYVLSRYYKRILLVVNKMPESSLYRKHVENIVKERSKIVNSNNDVKQIESLLGCGQIEEIILQARNELNLAEKLLLSRPWEELIAPAPKNQWRWPLK